MDLTDKFDGADLETRIKMVESGVVLYSVIGELVDLVDVNADDDRDEKVKFVKAALEKINEQLNRMYHVCQKEMLAQDKDQQEKAADRAKEIQPQE